jgi:hypothetical protein
MKKTLLITLIIIIAGFSFTAFAFDPSATGLTKTADTAKFSTAQTDISALVGNIIQGFLALIGIVLFIIVIYSGITWMLAGGDSGKVQKSKDYLTNGIIGLIVVALAYAISNFVLDAIITAQNIK